MERKAPIRGITTTPRGNPELERADLDRGIEKLARIAGN
jgi:hypothetical protein